ncbi:50S ribosomal protein L13 [Candidatus Comchoanobacter bicostacola]|uniref:Large ribosomal subunit protein uL13 n=1 Tax=Candidatus Comchoanobacter bicostacola TaxID=2919598 RepID=A0ABY5DIA2_9GAMM|nr:50S ribosomal protein L13 [Candidatus Comchoanobacter bicostacola]UTC24358.1 50S ribosomal protein L13 [Candidatus Comchoanobacter bicostacola]
MSNLRTYHAKTSDVPAKWVLVDLNKKVLGRASTQIATMLMGKDNPRFTPGVDLGVHVVVINADKVVCTSKDKKFYWHTGYPGGIKEEAVADRIKNKSDQVILKSVQRMLPKNKHGAHLLTKLRVFPGSEHAHAAQNPEQVEID